MIFHLSCGIALTIARLDHRFEELTGFRCIRSLTEIDAACAVYRQVLAHIVAVPYPLYTAASAFLCHGIADTVKIFFILYRVNRFRGRDCAEEFDTFIYSSVGECLSFHLIVVVSAAASSAVEDISILI